MRWPNLYTRSDPVAFRDDRFPNVDGPLAYVERLKGTAKLPPDMKLSITRAWGDPNAQLNGILQLSKALAPAARV
jgi:transcription-repair coupling factor (superfamily II helicase)